MRRIIIFWLIIFLPVQSLASVVLPCAHTFAIDSQAGATPPCHLDNSQDQTPADDDCCSHCAKCRLGFLNHSLPVKVVVQRAQTRVSDVVFALYHDFFSQVQISPPYRPPIVA